ncbi:alpha-(1,3)-fucosyltransferase C-like [Watersipora subatra]|uniref:alpha-(1,3)-fucosyltransferase C-like n=1 Tax=Watersipora subatra TaxID=2589382 RepID=UPI00355BE375
MNAKRILIRQLTSYSHSFHRGHVKTGKNTCFYEHGANSTVGADVIAFSEKDIYYLKTPPQKYPGQLWIFYSKEPQVKIKHASLQPRWDGFFNYSVTFDRTTEESYHVFRPRLMKITPPLAYFYTPYPNMLKLRALWCVSHCKKWNDTNNILGGREEYVLELSKYITIDLHTLARKEACPTTFKKISGTINRRGQPRMQDYMFYLSFENNLCKDYISGKFWKVLIANSTTIPVALGGLSMEDYASITPPHSFIHVRNFTSPKALAEHLQFVSQNAQAFNYYNKWKNEYKIDTSHFTMFDDYRSLGYYVDYMKYMCDLVNERPRNVWHTFSKDYTPNDCVNISQPEQP